MSPLCQESRAKDAKCGLLFLSPKCNLARHASCRFPHFIVFLDSGPILKYIVLFLSSNVNLRRRHLPASIFPRKMSRKLTTSTDDPFHAKQELLLGRLHKTETPRHSHNSETQKPEMPAQLRKLFNLTGTTPKKQAQYIFHILFF